MKPSLHPGKLLPESEEDFLLLEDRERAQWTCCIDCKKRFSAERVHSPAGWRETQISGMCETCFDNLFSEDEK